MSTRLLSGHEVEEVSEKDLKEWGFDMFEHGMVRIKPEGWLYPGTTPRYLDKIYNMEYKPDDVLLVTFPKSGTTWVQEILWTMRHNPKLDNPKANEPQFLRAIDMSLDMLLDAKGFGGVPTESFLQKFNETCPGKNKEEGIFIHLSDAMPSPRVLKTHFPLSLMPKDTLEKTKVVYVVRNPKDMAVSLYNFYRTLEGLQYKADMETLFKTLMKGQVFYGPYWEHVKEAWAQRNHPNMLFIFYEDMKADIMKELGRINEFLGTGFNQETLEAVAKYTSFSAMKSRGEPVKDKIFTKEDESEVKFFRKGKTGDWKNNFSPEILKEFDQWIRDNLAGTGLSLSWALAE